MVWVTLYYKRQKTNKDKKRNRNKKSCCPLPFFSSLCSTFPLFESILIHNPITYYTWHEHFNYPDDDVSQERRVSFFYFQSFTAKIFISFLRRFGSLHILDTIKATYERCKAYKDNKRLATVDSRLKSKKAERDYAEYESHEYNDLQAVSSSQISRIGKISSDQASMRGSRGKNIVAACKLHFKIFTLAPVSFRMNHRRKLNIF